MIRFQIRTPHNVVIQGLLEEMAAEGLLALQEYLISREIPSDDYEKFQQQIKQTLDRYIRAYDVCGQSLICSDEVEGGPWLDYTDHIYHLILPQTMDSFLFTLAREARESIHHLLRPGTEQEAIDLLIKVFRRHLSKYLYYNPVCGQEEICRKAKQISP